MIEYTLNQLRQLKLSGMASALQTQLDQLGTYEGLAFAERLQLLVDHQDQERKALCEIQWVVKFQLSAKEINHINEVIDIAIASGSPFSSTLSDSFMRHLRPSGV